MREVQFDQAPSYMKALIVYGTRWGGTIGIANKIGDIMKEEGFSVDVVDVKNQPEIKDYDLIIIGSGISGGKWTKESLKFLEDNSTNLKQKKTAFFASCGMVVRGVDLNKTREDYLLKVAEKYGLTPIDYCLFGGVLDFKAKYNLFDWILVFSSKNKLCKMGIDTGKPYDFRDWSNIESWTRNLIHNSLRLIMLQKV